ncbi:hypothetical protein ACHAW5_007304 [Stephanodiscus triporus]|uniref:PPIase cyclophilin-type domain-containing protein n=1 Tax=Stephanodiscus triporus TaxID=2934178 RepID=A0ABD3NFT5_9STRA
MKLPSALFPWLLAAVAAGRGGNVASAFRPPVVLPTAASVVGRGLRAIEPRKVVDGAPTPLGDDDGVVVDDGRGGGRRAFLLSRTLPAAAAAVFPPPLLLRPVSSANAASVPVQRAVGSAESKCQSEGNCLEKLDIDGAVGWNWGGVDRCDASDPLCGPDGTMRDGVPRGTTPPPRDDANYEITDVVVMTLVIGSGSNVETRTLRMGLYGRRCPESAREMIDLCGATGLVTSRDLLLGSPVRLGRGGGSLTYVRPGERIDFGVPSQRVAYARSTRKAKAPDEYVPQTRPGGDRLKSVREEVSGRGHDAAGLVSIPREGIGYGGGLVLGKDDEAYASSFQITARAVPEMDGEGRKVIGQLLDGESMDVLARLAGSPTRKMLPGQNGGTPLIKVNVEDCAVYSVAVAKL